MIYATIPCPTVIGSDVARCGPMGSDRVISHTRTLSFRLCKQPIVVEVKVCVEVFSTQFCIVLAKKMHDDEDVVFEVN